MLRVSTFVSTSQIHGKGLYAAEPIRRGEVVWRFDADLDRVFSDEELEEEILRSRQPLRSWVYQAEPGLWVLCGDDAVYMNHSDDPSCDDPDPRRTVARRDIDEGEELTVDYRQFDLSASLWLDAIRPARRVRTS